MLISICLAVFVVNADAKIINESNVNTIEEPKETNNVSHKREASVQAIVGKQVEGVVITEYGPVRGFQKDSGIWRYYDIPYGAFTIENPFQAPDAPEAWSEAREENEHKSRCPQIDPDTDVFAGTSDCLTLSVFTPADAQNNDVLFHIHEGGSFSSGSGDDKVYGPEYLVPSGIILVLPNYRVGSLGFLCLQTDAIPGNAGLKDLVLALEWTRDNIEAFGGNSSKIAVSGSGSAAALVEYLVTSSKSKNIITKAITESGSMLSHWAIDRQPVESASILKENLSKINSASTVRTFTDQLKEASLEELVKASIGISFKPCIETDANGFLTNTPMSVLLSADLSINIMTGAANVAGMHYALQHTEDSLSQINKDSTLLLPNDLEMEEEHEDEIAQRVRRQYFDEHDVTSATVRQLATCYTDHSYLSPAVRAARLLVGAGATVYFYEFSFGNEEENVAVLGESMKYVFSRGNIFVENTLEYKMETFMRNIWVNFIKTGVPKPEGIDWQKFEKTKDEDEKWLSIDSTVKAQNGLHLDRLRLWDEVYKNHFIDRSKSSRKTIHLFTISICMLMIVGNQASRPAID